MWNDNRFESIPPSRAQQQQQHHHVHTKTSLHSSASSDVVIVPRRFAVISHHLHDGNIKLCTQWIAEKMLTTEDVNASRLERTCGEKSRCNRYCSKCLHDHRWSVFCVCLLCTSSLSPCLPVALLQSYLVAYVCTYFVYICLWARRCICRLKGTQSQRIRINLDAWSLGVVLLFIMMNGWSWCSQQHFAIVFVHRTSMPNTHVTKLGRLHYVNSVILVIAVKNF